jgi:hypothetical protein
MVTLRRSTLPFLLKENVPAERFNVECPDGVPFNTRVIRVPLPVTVMCCYTCAARFGITVH